MFYGTFPTDKRENVLLLFLLIKDINFPLLSLLLFSSVWSLQNDD